MVNINRTILSNINIFPNECLEDDEHKIGLYCGKKLYRKRTVYTYYAETYELGIENVEIINMNAYIVRKDYPAMRQRIPSRLRYWLQDESDDMMVDIRQVNENGTCQLVWGANWQRNHSGMLQYIVFIVEYIKK